MSDISLGSMPPGTDAVKIAKRCRKKEFDQAESWGGLTSK